MSVPMSDSKLTHTAPSFRRFTRAAVAAIVALGVLAPTVFGNSYAGWGAAIEKLGIKGYIEQHTLGTVAGSDLVASWFGLCANACNAQPYADSGSGVQWVQLGMYQGSFSGASSPSAVRMYYENMDPCGDYHSLDVGAPPSNPYRFVVWYPGGGSHLYTCANGAPYNAYTFNFRKGGTTAPVFATGWMSTSDGLAQANIEWHGSPTQSTIYFGCSAGSCGDSDFGVRVLQHNGTDWVDKWSAITIGPSNPPWRRTFNSYWSFRTCQTQAVCSQ
jgi:hypothetical protein